MVASAAAGYYAGAYVAAKAGGSAILGWVAGLTAEGLAEQGASDLLNGELSSSSAYAQSVAFNAVTAGVVGGAQLAGRRASSSATLLPPRVYRVEPLGNATKVTLATDPKAFIIGRFDPETGDLMVDGIQVPEYLQGDKISTELYRELIHASPSDVRSMSGFPSGSNRPNRGRDTPRVRSLNRLGYTVHTREGRLMRSYRPDTRPR